MVLDITAAQGAMTGARYKESLRDGRDPTIGRRPQEKAAKQRGLDQPKLGAVGPQPRRVGALHHRTIQSP